VKVILNAILNRVVRMLDGQWQGLRIARDGCVYFFGGSHRPGVSAPFFRYDPQKHAVETITLDMSAVCGEDPAQVPTQGKVHSDLLEHEGWLYFGTHLSDYTPEGAARYTGAHLVGYELATGAFRDFGVIHPNFTNYSGIGLDRTRNRIYFYATPFAAGNGPHLHRIALRTGENQDLGLIAPRTDHTRHGQASAFLFVDSRGDCWFTLREQGPLFVARAESGRIEAHAEALPPGNRQWHCVRPLDPDRALVILQDGLWLFDASRFDGTPRAFERLLAVETPGWTWAYLALDAQRIYWNSRSQHRLPTTGRYEVQIHSVDCQAPGRVTDHGPMVDADGRAPWFIGDLASDGRGRLYACGRWYALSEEFETIGVNRHSLMCIACFTVLDVSTAA